MPGEIEPMPMEPQAPLIRRAVATDLERLLALYRELSDAPEESDPPAGPEARAALAAALADPSRHLVVATVNGDVVGTADLLIVQNLTHGARPWGIVENVVVTHAQRGSGIGTAVLEHLLAIARGAGCYKVQLLSGKHRQRAHGFYRATGFEPVAEGFKLYLDEG